MMLDLPCESHRVFYRISLGGVVKYYRGGKPGNISDWNEVVVAGEDGAFHYPVFVRLTRDRHLGVFSIENHHPFVDMSSGRVQRFRSVRDLIDDGFVVYAYLKDGFSFAD